MLRQVLCVDVALHASQRTAHRRVMENAERGGEGGITAREPHGRDGEEAKVVLR